MSNEAKLVGTFLTLLPVVEKIREKYKIVSANAGESQLQVNVTDNDHVDWVAVRQDIETWIREYPDLLPPELGEIKKWLDLQKKFPPEPVFTEPVTEKLKLEVTMLYKAFLHVYNLFVKHNAAPWEIVIENYYRVITENLFEYIFTGEIREIPEDWISNVVVNPVLGENVVMAMANQFADPEEIMERFQQKFDETFGTDRPNITKGNVDTAPYLIKKLQGMVIKDIADDYIQDHRADFPDDEESDEYRAKKRLEEERLDTAIRRLLETIDRIFPVENSENPVP